MTTLEQLKIQGIRSFNESDPQLIDFQKPLTLIVGKNGSGKTTIIEALRYMTTGEAPMGTGKGASFVHDPSVSNMDDTKARISLQFYARNKKYVATRILQVTKKKGGGNTFKTLDGLVGTRQAETGEWVTSGKKCSQMDELLPTLFGVSKAVLDSVIFTHQEDSFWPLSEPSALKKRFDDIFSVSQYTKALNNLKDIKKDKAAQLQMATQQLHYLKENKDKSKAMRSQLLVIEEDIVVTSQKIATLTKELEDLSVEVKEMEDQFHRYTVIDDQLDRLVQNRQMMLKQQEDLEHTSTLVEGSDEELQRIIDEQKDKIAGAENDAVVLQKMRDQLIAELSRLQGLVTVKASERGRYQSDHDAFSRRQEQRDDVVLTLTEKYGLVQQPNVVEFMKVFQAEVNKVESQLKDSRERNRATESSINEQISRVSLQKQTMTEQKTSKRKQRQEKNLKQSELYNDINKMSQESSDFDVMKTRLQQLQEDLAGKKTNLRAINGDMQLKQLDSELSLLLTKQVQLKEEFLIINRQSDIRAKLSLKQTEEQRQVQVLTRLDSFCRNALSDLGIESGPDIKKSVLDTLADKRARYQELQQRSLTFKTELVKVGTLLRVEQEKHVSMEHRCSDLHGRIAAVCVPGSYSQQLAQTQLQLSQAQRQVAVFSSGTEVYKHLLEMAKKESHCPLCSAAVDSAHLTLMAEKVKNITELAPDQQKQAKQQLTSLQATMSELSNLKPSFDEWQRIKSTTLADLEIYISDLNSQHEKISTDMQDCSLEFQMFENELESIKLLRSKVTEMVQREEEIKTLKSEVASIQSELSYSGVNKSPDEISEELDVVEQKEAKLRRDMHRINQELKMRQDVINASEKELNTLNVSVLNLEHRLSQKDVLLVRKNSLSEEVQQLDKEMRDLEALALRLEPDLEALNKQRKEMQVKSQDEETTLLSTVDDMNRQLRNLVDLQSHVSEYQRNSYHLRVRRVDADIANLNGQLSIVQNQLTSINDRLQDMSQSMSKFQVLTRNIQDTFKLRRLAEDLSTINEQIQELKRRRNMFSMDRYKKQYDTVKAQLNDVFGQKAGLQGEQRQLELQKAQNIQTYDADYKNTDQLYREQMCKLNTAKAALSDVELAYKALDNAIMKYHQTKMEQINKTIKHLWEKTYRGHDIDTIQICHDEDKQVKGNRTYNYRVVMVKETSQLDIRGRCSAGQKVLASLIIRLALSETFCVDCGILTLDEPTTNLDAANAASLAEALNDIIAERRTLQENFQLIVITHDENFMRQLGIHSQVDNFIQVSKDNEGYSKVALKSLSGEY